jgi:hypothetical protein
MKNPFKTQERRIPEQAHTPHGSPVRMHFYEHSVPKRGFVLYKFLQCVPRSALQLLIGIDQKNPLPLRVLNGHIAGNGEIIPPGAEVYMCIEGSGDFNGCIAGARVDHDYFINCVSDAAEAPGKMRLLVFDDHACTDT